MSSVSSQAKNHIIRHGFEDLKCLDIYFEIEIEIKKEYAFFLQKFPTWVMAELFRNGVKVPRGILFASMPKPEGFFKTVSQVLPPL